MPCRAVEFGDVEHVELAVLGQARLKKEAMTRRRHRIAPLPDFRPLKGWVELPWLEEVGLLVGSRGGAQSPLGHVPLA